jgi:hypothetical protein
VGRFSSQVKPGKSNGVSKNCPRHHPPRCLGTKKNTQESPSNL